MQIFPAEEAGIVNYPYLHHISITIHHLLLHSKMKHKFSQLCSLHKFESKVKKKTPKQNNKQVCEFFVINT